MNKEKIKQTTILIVDDKIVNLDILLTYLEDFGFRLMVAQSGNEMLERLERVIPDMILLDVCMPDMDGFEACRRVKEVNEYKKIPVIFITALSDTINKVKGFELGAVDYVTKPFQQEEVLARIKTHLTIERLRKQLQTKNLELKKALDQVKVLSGILPICSACKKIRDDKGSWNHMESYIREHSEAEFTHGICPDCAIKLYPDLF
ncbi:MAG: response regulator [Desulfobacteraceae bacterium]|nr:response regulator [Desulfobacteraceae bacterium]